MVLAVVVVVVMLVVAFAAAAGAFNRPTRIARRERVVVEQPVATEVVTERRVERDRPL